MTIFFSVFAGVLASFLLLKLLIPFLRRRILDRPNSRSSHRFPVPRAGGLVFVLTTVSASALALIFNIPGTVNVLPFLCLPLSIVGLVDDRFDLPSFWRFAVQLFTACSLLAFGNLFSFNALFSDLSFPLGLLLFCVITLFSVATINFTNFMDGLDGLVAGCMLVIFAFAALSLSSPICLWVLFGSLFGFLLFNWCPAQVFMGDVGSTFLGSMFSGLVLQSSDLSMAFGLILLATPLLADSFLCLLRRFFAGQPIFEAHRLHLYQRLHQAGWSHAKVSSTYILSTAFLALSLLLGGLPFLVFSVCLVLLLGVCLEFNFAVPFVDAS